MQPAPRPDGAYPPDGHVHTEWSWDARRGSMEATCARAVELGLPSIAFTEHAEFGVWTPVSPEAADDIPEWAKQYQRPDGVVVPPLLDVEGYLACVDRCRGLYPELRILTGVELSEPHWHSRRTTELLDLGGFDRVLGSVHTVRHPDSRLLDPGDAYSVLAAEAVVREYLAEVARMATGSDLFAVLAHIDYPMRYWPAAAGPVDPHLFEEEYRYALRALAGAGRALEVNTQVPLHPVVVRWWREEGGRTLTFGSDAHEAAKLADGLVEAAAMVEANGFRPGRHPYDFWVRG